MSGDQDLDIITEWVDKLEAITEKIDSPAAASIYVGKDYSKADLRRDILDSIPEQYRSNKSPTV